MSQNNTPYTIEITDTAWEMLISHARFLANVSVPAANRLVDNFMKATDSLTIMPERHPWLDNDDFPFQKYRKLLLDKHYMALFQIRENTIYISAVVDCRQDYSWL